MPAAPAILTLPLLLTTAAATPAAVGQAPVEVVVTAAPPVDSQRLADAMRAYLEEYGIRVENGGPAAGGDLRVRLADARRLGEEVRALAVVRAEEGAPGAIEIQLVDLATDKALLAELPRPARDQDLYRALALKIQALLRATLSEAPEQLGAGSTLERLVAPAGGHPAAARAPARVSFETGYALLAFPLAQVGLQGLAATASYAPRPWLELALGSAALGSARAQAGDVVAVANLVPVTAAARLRAARGRTELLLGPAAELAYVGVTPSSTVSEVHASRDLLVALGAEAEARLSSPGGAAWLFVRLDALGVLLGQRYRVDGQLVLDTSRAQLAASAGIGVGVW